MEDAMRFWFILAAVAVAIAVGIDISDTVADPARLPPP